jgi:hypothetical protein
MTMLAEDDHEWYTRKQSPRRRCVQTLTTYHFVFCLVQRQGGRGSASTDLPVAGGAGEQARGQVRTPPRFPQGQHNVIILLVLFPVRVDLIHPTILMHSIERSLHSLDIQVSQ